MDARTSMMASKSYAWMEPMVSNCGRRTRFHRCPCGSRTAKPSAGARGCFGQGLLRPLEASPKNDVLVGIPARMHKSSECDWTTTERVEPDVPAGGEKEGSE